MTAKLTRLTHKIAIQLHLVAESCTIFSSVFRQPVRKLLDTPSYSNSAKVWTIGVLGFDSWRRGLGTTVSRTGSGAYAASYPICTEGSFPGVKAAGP
jgi:hypothetical protein